MLFSLSCSTISRQTWIVVRLFVVLILMKLTFLIGDEDRTDHRHIHNTNSHNRNHTVHKDSYNDNSRRVYSHNINIPGSNNTTNINHNEGKSSASSPKAEHLS